MRRCARNVVVRRLATCADLREPCQPLTALAETASRASQEIGLTYFHGDNTGSNPVGDANYNQKLICAWIRCIRAPSREAKGVFHINAVDQGLQWQIVGATPRISAAYLKPVLEAMLRQFPFRIQGFHTDNGSEFINRTVAELLNKLL